LLKSGKHKVTAITRSNSLNELPSGVICSRVDYSQPNTVIAALKGHDALVITLRAGLSQEVDMMLINSAAQAGVPWILPNEWAPDTDNEELRRDISVFNPQGKHTQTRIHAVLLTIQS
jgi:saccharopine dehydrogenase-like NADP-dependent oxidoreductase